MWPTRKDHKSQPVLRNVSSFRIFHASVDMNDENKSRESR